VHDLGPWQPYAVERVVAVMDGVTDDWKRELPGIREYFAEFGDRLPPRLVAQLDALETRLG